MNWYISNLLMFALFFLFLDFTIKIPNFKNRLLCQNYPESHFRKGTVTASRFPSLFYTDASNFMTATGIARRASIARSMRRVCRKRDFKKDQTGRDTHHCGCREIWSSWDGWKRQFSENRAVVVENLVDLSLNISDIHETIYALPCKFCWQT